MLASSLGELTSEHNIIASEERGCGPRSILGSSVSAAATEQSSISITLRAENRLSHSVRTLRRCGDVAGPDSRQEREQPRTPPSKGVLAGRATGVNRFPVPRAGRRLAKSRYAESRAVITTR